MALGSSLMEMGEYTRATGLGENSTGVENLLKTIRLYFKASLLKGNQLEILSILKARNLLRKFNTQNNHPKLVLAYLN